MSNVDFQRVYRFVRAVAFGLSDKHLTKDWAVERIVDMTLKGTR